MTDKQITDGVNVSECKHKDEWYCYANGEWNMGIYEFGYCEKNPGCYYRQLKRLQDDLAEKEKDLKEALEQLEVLRNHKIALECYIRNELKRGEN